MRTSGPSDNVLIPQHFGSLLYVRKRHEYIPYDHLTTRILLFCRHSSLFELPTELDMEINGKQKNAFYSLGRDLKFLDRKGSFIGRSINRRVPANHLMSPLTLHLSITQSCDLRCRHCFAAPEMDSSDGSLLTISEMDRLFDQASELGCMRIALTGGEPLNRPDLFSIIDRISMRGIDVCITTNGVRIDRHVAREFAKRPFAWVNVSLEGATPETNDAVRGNGTFEKVVANLKRFLKWRVRFSLSITLNKLNLHEIPLFNALAANVGAESIIMRGVYPIGGAAESKELCLTFSEYQMAISELRRVNSKTQVIPTSCEAVDSCDELASIYENFGCAAGNSVATVYHNGDVSPCSLIGDGIELDNIRNKSLADIWNHGKGFNKIRKISPAELCRSCDSLNSCSGGCRARAWAAHGDISSPDPWCKHLPGVSAA